MDYAINNFRLSYGVGLALKLGGIARVELNYCIPIRAQRGDRPAPGLQLGVGVSFLWCGYLDKNLVVFSSRCRNVWIEFILTAFKLKSVIDQYFVRKLGTCKGWFSPTTNSLLTFLWGGGRWLIQRVVMTILVSSLYLLHPTYHSVIEGSLTNTAQVSQKCNFLKIWARTKSSVWHS